MVDIDSTLPLSELYPHLHSELKVLRTEVVSTMLAKTDNLQAYMERLGRLIATQSEIHGISLFAAAELVWKRSDFLSIPPIVAIAAAIEMTQHGDPWKDA